MLKKLAIIGLSALVLGGCTLQGVKNSLMGTGSAATDTQTGANMTTSTSPTTTPAPTSATTPDAALQQANPSTSPQNDDKSLETDVNNTNVVKEDFSNLGQ